MRRRRRGEAHLRWCTLSAVDAERLGRRYGDAWGLRNATFAVGEGAIAVLAGPNGAGKTTTTRILATVLKPTTGRASVAGYDVVADYREVRRRIAYVPQEIALDYNVTPREAVRWFLVARGLSLGASKRQAEIWLERLGLDEHGDVPLRRLSGGLKRRTLLAMVLAAEAEVALLDEPTAGLDVASRHATWAILEREAKSGTTFLGLLVVLYVRNPQNVSAITNPINTLTTTLPPVYYTASMLPEWARPIALLSPTTAFAELGRWCAGLGTCYPIWVLAAEVAAWALAALSLAARELKWGPE